MRRTRGALVIIMRRNQNIEPFKRLIKSKSKWLALIKDFNFNYVPSQLSFKADVFRQFGATRPRNVGGGPYKIPETYDKYLHFRSILYSAMEPDKVHIILILRQPIMPG